MLCVYVLELLKLGPYTLRHTLRVIPVTLYILMPPLYMYMVLYIYIYGFTHWKKY